MLTCWLALQLAICAAALVLISLPKFMPALSARSLPGLHYAAVVLVLAVAMFAPWLPADIVNAPVAWMPVTMDHRAESVDGMFAGAQVLAHPWMPRLDDVGMLLLASSVLAAAGVAASFTRDFWHLRRLRQRAQLVRRHGRVRVWICDEAISPFSFRGLRHAHVFVPQCVVARHEWFRLALAHELQHHRQRDTSWLYLFGVLRLVCGLNPFAWWWSAELRRVQELACDENLLGRGRWSVSSYAHGLLDVAKAAAPYRGMTWASSLLGKRHSLKRRIEEMMKPQRIALAAPARAALFTGLLAALALTTATASSLTGTATGAGSAHASGALPIRTGALAAAFEIPEEGAARRGHGGVDIVAPAGTAVYAWNEGVVLHAGERKGCGLAVVLQHWQGTRSTYCNLAELRVTTGESVRRDQPLGELANLGAAKKAHLHFEIEIGGRKVDPAKQIDLLALK